MDPKFGPYDKVISDHPMVVILDLLEIAPAALGRPGARDHLKMLKILGVKAHFVQDNGRNVLCGGLAEHGWLI